MSRRCWRNAASRPAAKRSAAGSIRRASRPTNSLPAEPHSGSCTVAIDTNPSPLSSRSRSRLGSGDRGCLSDCSPPRSLRLRRLNLTTPSQAPGRSSGPHHHPAARPSRRPPAAGHARCGPAIARKSRSAARRSEAGRTLKPRGAPPVDAGWLASRIPAGASVRPTCSPIAAAHAHPCRSHCGSRRSGSDSSCSNPDGIPRPDKRSWRQ